MKLKVQSISYTLGLLSWDVFGTLTFKNPVPIRSRCWGCAYAHFHAVAKSLNVPYSQLGIALRSELGEVGGRFHFHYLLKLPKKCNNISVAHICEREWRNRVGAIADVRAYESSLSGAEYVVKCLSAGKQFWANEYERSKFDRANEVELSDAVFSRVKALRSTVDTPSPSERGLSALTAQPTEQKSAELFTLAPVGSDAVKDDVLPWCPQAALEVPKRADPVTSPQLFLAT